MFDIELGVEHGEVKLVYSSCPGEPERFTHLTDLEADNSSAWELSSHGRMRWKIENEGFRVTRPIK